MERSPNSPQSYGEHRRPPGAASQLFYGSGVTVHLTAKGLLQKQSSRLTALYSRSVMMTPPRRVVTRPLQGGTCKKQEKKQ
jgi:hypothetical protein